MFRTLMLSLLMAFAALAPLAGCSTANAADEVFATADGAIRGYDPVAYHTESKAVRGKADITHAWNGATWRFASTANRDRFAADPERYAPRYGGFCAYGTAQGYKVSTDPDAFAIVDGRQQARAGHLEPGPPRLHPQGGCELGEAGTCGV